MERVYRITGHRVSPSYSASKLRWVRDHEPQHYERAVKMLHAKDFIVARLTGEIVTDYSDACGTNLFDIERKAWSSEIAHALEIDTSLLPTALSSTCVVGPVTAEAASATGLAERTPVVIGAGDGVCAATGAAVVEPGAAYVVIGTSSWIATASERPVFDPLMRTFTWAHVDERLYSPCGTMQAAGFSYGWIRDRAREFAASQPGNAAGDPASNRSPAAELGVDAIDAALTRAAAASQAGAGGLLFLPYLMGERSPRWNPDARGAFVGLGATTGAGDLVRSVLEGVGFNLRVILEAIRASGEYREIIAIGGGARNERWLQILADIWDANILVPRYVEDATSMGAALCGGVGVGAIEGFGAAHRFNPVERVIAPDPKHHAHYEKLYPLFNRVYESLTALYSELAAVRE
jgi:xylulokinase